MKKILATSLCALALSSCALVHVHKMDIEQGNILTQERVSKIHTGMPIADVKALLGNPVLINTFANNRIDYVYTYQPGYGPKTEHYVTIIFTKNRVSQVSGNMYSQFIK
jgi:outer membrane protein assembly factor BamE